MDTNSRMLWWKNAKFGMFIHWGLYSILAGAWKGKEISGPSEWIMAYGGIPRDEYEMLASQFNPSKFNAADWVSLAKLAGMKYLIVTAKHHDGFSMWPSKISEYNVESMTSYRDDILSQIAKECAAQGLRFGCYYSILDWHHPTQSLNVRPEAKTLEGKYALTTIIPERKEEYVAYMKAQLEELVINYNPAVFWFDGEWVPWWTEQDGVDLYNYIRSLKDDVIVNNRIGKSRKGMSGFNKTPQFVGDYCTPELQIPEMVDPAVSWETCMTINDSWGFRLSDHNWKSSETIHKQLQEVNSKGGNYLLNIGPTADGVFPEESQKILRELSFLIK